MKRLETLKQRAAALKMEAHALYLACKDPRVPWYAKAFVACVIGYALSPVDLIPDPIPLLGQLDDLVLVPLGVLAARRMIPACVLTECRERARAAMQEGKRVNRTAAVLVVVVWLLSAVALGWLFFRARPTN
jgi:uncharacterized membrane protein YkvA (DUF1232 family)